MSFSIFLILPTYQQNKLSTVSPTALIPSTTAFPTAFNPLTTVFATDLATFATFL